MPSMPAALPFVYQNDKIGWGYQSGPEPHLDGRTIYQKLTANRSAAIMIMAEKISDRILNKPALPPSNAAYYKAA